MYYGIPVAAACAFEVDHHTLRNVGQGHVVLEEGVEEEGSARSRADRRSHDHTAYEPAQALQGCTSWPRSRYHDDIARSEGDGRK